MDTNPSDPGLPWPSQYSEYDALYRAGRRGDSRNSFGIEQWLYRGRSGVWSDCSIRSNKELSAGGYSEGTSSTDFSCLPVTLHACKHSVLLASGLGAHFIGVPTAPPQRRSA